MKNHRDEVSSSTQPLGTSAPAPAPRHGRHLKPAMALGGAAAAATLALFPYLEVLMPAQLARLPAPLWIVALAQSAQTGVLCALMAWLGLAAGAPHGLDAPWLRAWSEGSAPAPAPRSRWGLAVSCGLLTGACVAGLSLIWTGAGGAQGGGEAAGWAWRGLLASFYGGIVEEVQSRLLLVSVFVWLLARLHPPARAWTFAMAILLAALLFGAGHLPAAFAAGLARGPLPITRIVVLNMLAGTVFGALFWKLGLEHAMVAHFCADLMLHAALPALSG